MSAAGESPNDQADALRTLAERVERPVIAILGAKGGVGASSVTLALAEALAERRVSAFDAHWGQQDLPAVARLWWPHTSLRIVALGELLIDAPHSPREQDADHLVEEIRDRGNHAALIDAGAAATPWAGALAKRADATIVVATPDRLAALNAYAAVKRMRLEGVEPSLVWNGCPDAPSSQAAHRRINATCDQAGVDRISMAGWLPARDSEDRPAARGAYRLAAVRLADELLPGGRARRLERPTITAA